MRRMILSLFLLFLLASVSVLGSFPLVKAQTEYTEYRNLLVDNFIPTVEEWDRIGADYQIDSDDNDTSYIWFNYSTNEVKTLSYFTYENITFESKRGVNITSILNATVYYRGRCDGVGNWFRFSGWWFDGSTWLEDDGVGSGTGDWYWADINLTSILDTPEKVQNAKVRFANPGAPTTEYPGRVTYARLLVWFTYVQIYVYPLRLILGLLGLVIMIISPTIGIREILKKKNWEMIGGCMALFCIGYALVLVWLIP